VTSVDEALARDLPVTQVIVDGVGETADELRALDRLGDQLECVYWIGFDPPNRQLPGLVLINPLSQIDGLIEALTQSPNQSAATMVPIEILDPEPLPEGTGDWNMPVVQPAKPIDRPLPTLAPINLHLEEDEETEDSVVDADFKVQRAYNWKVWVPPIISTIVILLVAFLFVRSSYKVGKTIALPETAETMPSYTMNGEDMASQPAANDLIRPKVKINPIDLPENSALVTPTRKTPVVKKNQKMVTPFDESRLKVCLKGLGKKGSKWLKKKGSVRVSMRLGIMGDGRVAAATTSGVRIGRKKYRSSRFNACIEGKVVGQQLSIRPEREPTFVKRTFKIRR